MACSLSFREVGAGGIQGSNLEAGAEASGGVPDWLAPHVFPSLLCPTSPEPLTPGLAPPTMIWALPHPS